MTSCQTNAVCTGDETVATVYQFGYHEIPCRFETLVTHEPIDLTGVTEIVARFENADDTVLEKKMTESGITIVHALAGKIRIILTAAETALLKVGEDQSFEVIITIDGKPRVFQFEESLTVKQQLFSS